MLELLLKLANVLLLLIAIKAIVIGSEFNFYSWLRDGKKYSKWYSNRPKYNKEVRKNGIRKL